MAESERTPESVQAVADKYIHAWETEWGVVVNHICIGTKMSPEMVMLYMLLHESAVMREAMKKIMEAQLRKLGGDDEWRVDA